MKIETIDEIIECLPRDRTLFYYFRDRHVIYILHRVLTASRGMRLSQLRQSPWRRLLEKPILRPLLSMCGNGRVTAGELDQLWPANPESYRLTLGCWGSSKDYRWQQTSRPGANLVLQLNFNRYHDTEFSSWTGVEELQAFNFYGHPVAHGRNNTLAWARLDIDLVTGEVLIEEIQTDWVRKVKRAMDSIDRSGSRQAEMRFRGCRINSRGMRRYYEDILRPHEKYWCDAMLLSTIWFIHQELGINRIYYHTFETGAVLKNIHGMSPPRSLYTALPKRFCFETCDQGPEFLRQSKPALHRLKKMKQPTWFRLAA